jgi:hypothetical protein
MHPRAIRSWSTLPSTTRWVKRCARQRARSRKRSCQTIYGASCGSLRSKAGPSARRPKTIRRPPRRAGQAVAPKTGNAYFFGVVLPVGVAGPGRSRLTLPSWPGCASLIRSSSSRSSSGRVGQSPRSSRSFFPIALSHARSCSPAMHLKRARSCRVPDSRAALDDPLMYPPQAWRVPGTFVPCLRLIADQEGKEAGRL